MGMKQITATAMGTVSLRDGTIVHLDPDNSTENGRYQTVSVPEGDVKRFVDAGLIDGDKVKDAKDDEASTAGVVGITADVENDRIKDAIVDTDEGGVRTVATTAGRNYPANQPTLQAEEGLSAGDPDAAPEPAPTTKRGRAAASN